MLKGLTRWQAWVVAAVLALACICAALFGGIKQPAEPARGSLYTDLMLYREVAEMVADGRGYYAAATELHRAHGYPTAPFFTVRLPTLAWLGAAFGWSVLQITLATLLSVTVVAWYRRLEGVVGRGEQIAVAVLLLLGGAMVSQAALVPQHDQWVGLLLALAAALRTPRTWPAAVLVAGLALAIRELAIAFVMLALVFALWQRRRREAAAWGALIVAFVAGMALHARAVMREVLPGDPHSQGWDALRGPLAPLADLADMSVLGALPAAIAAPLAVLALFGWAGAPARVGGFVLPWLIGWATAIALFARADTSYWAIQLLPAWFGGLAFVPRGLRDLGRAMAGRALAGRQAAL